MTRFVFTVFALASTSCVACGDSPHSTNGTGSSTGDGDGGKVEVYRGTGPRSGVDILFVIDNSFSMQAPQIALSEALPTLTRVLENISGEPPNLHVGVVTTDIGSGDQSIGGCSEGGYQNGDNGGFLTSGCPQLEDGASFLEDVAGGDGDGERTRNYEGTLADALACMVQVGIGGCAFEQPFEATRRALDAHGPNPAQVSAFLRADAVLGVAFLSDEDDCSASSSELFSAPDSTEADPLGYLGSFRCFEFGVSCDEDPRQRGAKVGCEPDNESQLVTPVADFVEFLRGLKDDPQDIVVAGIVGPPLPVLVRDSADTRDGRPELAPACEGPGGVSAVPAIRHRALLRSFPRRSVFDVCDLGFDDALLAFALDLVASVGPLRCFGIEVAEVDIEGLGTQPDCAAFLLEENGNESTRVEVPVCETLNQQDCLGFGTDPGTCGDTTPYGVDLLRLPPVAADGAQRFSVECTPR